MMPFYTVFALVLVGMVIPTLARDTTQRISLYYGAKGSERNKVSFNKTYNPDLEGDTDGLHDAVYQVCLTGTWLLYEFQYYNQGTNGKMEYMYKPNQKKCFDFDGWQPLSIRFAGNGSNFRDDSITLYTGTYFQGSEEKIFTDASKLELDKNIRSLAITGKSPWTIYTGKNHKGKSFCLPPTKNYTPLFVFDTEELSTRVKHDTIRSIKKGCAGKVTFITGTEYLLAKQYGPFS